MTPRMLAKFIAVAATLPLLATSVLAETPAGPWKNQRYWDGKVSPPLQWSRGCTNDPQLFARDNPAYASPPLMAIGDSLYNGVQSLRINWWLSEWSAPNLVAIRMGLINEKNADRTGERSFYSPQYKKHGSGPDEVVNYGFNLERKSKLTSLGNFWQLNSAVWQQKALLQELKDYRPPNRRGMIDNIAFSGANTLDLLHWTPNDYQALADKALASFNPLFPFLSFGPLGDAFSYGNAAFVLNPMRDKCIGKLTPLQQVELRRPKRLLINIGSNNGLYKVAFFGTSVDDERICGSQAQTKTASGKPICVAPISTFLGQQYKDDMKMLIERLSRVQDLEYVYINNIALPKQVANVIPKDKSHYGIDILNGSLVKADVIEEGNKLADAANKILKRLIADRTGKPGPKFVLVDVQNALDQRDYKGCEASNKNNCHLKRLAISTDMSGVSKTFYLDNRPMLAEGDSGVTTGNDFAAKLKKGGLFSFDNMHLSSIGYEIMAETVYKEMHREERDAVRPKGVIPGRCSSRPFRQGDCAALLTKPGWSFSDYTRRDFVFQRLAGDREMKSLSFMKALMDFAN